MINKTEYSNEKNECCVRLDMLRNDYDAMFASIQTLIYANTILENYIKRLQKDIAEPSYIIQRHNVDGSNLKYYIAHRNHAYNRDTHTYTIDKSQATKFSFFEAEKIINECNSFKNELYIWEIAQ